MHWTSSHPSLGGALQVRFPNSCFNFFRLLVKLFNTCFEVRIISKLESNPALDLHVLMFCKRVGFIKHGQTFFKSHKLCASSFSTLKRTRTEAQLHKKEIDLIIDQFNSLQKKYDNTIILQSPECSNSMIRTSNSMIRSMKDNRNKLPKHV